MNFILKPIHWRIRFLSELTSGLVAGIHTELCTSSGFKDVGSILTGIPLDSNRYLRLRFPKDIFLKDIFSSGMFHFLRELLLLFCII